MTEAEVLERLPRDGHPGRPRPRPGLCPERQSLRSAQRIGSTRSAHRRDRDLARLPEPYAPAWRAADLAVTGTLDTWLCPEKWARRGSIVPPPCVTADLTDRAHIEHTRTLELDRNPAG